VKRIERVSPSSSSIFRHESGTTRAAGLLGAFAMLGSILLATESRAGEQEPVMAVWKERQLQFSYQRSTAVHSCSELQNRITNVLRAVGARPDLKVTLRNCDVPHVSRPLPGRDGGGWPRDAFGSSPGYDPQGESIEFVDVYVLVSMPVEMTPEVIAELEVDKKRRRLITEVTGDPLPLFDDPIAFTARRQTVSLSRETVGLKAADCELLDRLVTSSFKTLGIEVLRRNLTCHRGWRSQVAPAIDVVALVPTFYGNDAGEGTSESSDDEPDPPRS
jgi:hypothetical protein